MKGQLKKYKNAIKWENGNKDLENFMYENELEDNTEQFSPYHFRIKTSKATIDIWAGVKKFYIHGLGCSTHYNNINELKKYI